MGEIKLNGFYCERCNHKWVPRNGKRPIVCPKCKSPYWDTPRKKALKVEKENTKKPSGIFPNNKRGERRDFFV